MNEIVVGRVEFCPKACCSREVGIDTIAKVITETLEREMPLTKGFFEEDEKQAEKQPIYVITYECGKEIKQEKIVAESIGELLDFIEEVVLIGFHAVNGKILYIKTDNIIEVREYDDKQDELVKLTSHAQSTRDAFIEACEIIKNDIKADDERKWYCTAHWLNSFYQDFILERKAGEYMPCSTCDYVETCKDCPLINFQIMNEKTDHPISVHRIKKNNNPSFLEK